MLNEIVKIKGATVKEKTHTHYSSKGIDVTFPNGYGASIVQGKFTYTDNSDEYELAVMKEGSICYDTPLTDDVLGHLDYDDVMETLIEISEL